MTAPAPGWHPDPTARFAYRYWDGGDWTDDVTDGGTAAIDPVPLGEAGGAGWDPYAGHDGGPDGWGRWDGWESYERYPYAGPGEDLAVTGLAGAGEDAVMADRRGKDRSAGRLVGVGLVVTALVAGVAFALSGAIDGGESAGGTEISDRGARDGEGGSGGGEDRGTGASGETTTTTGPPTSTPTTGGGPAGSAPGGSGGAGGGSGSPGTTGGGQGSGGGAAGGGQGSGGGGGASSDDAAMVEEVATMMSQSSGGQVSDEQAHCMAEGMLEALGPEGMRAMMGTGGSTAAPPPMSAEDYQALQSLTVDCGVAQAPTG